jgi:hypothetical protein
VSVVDQRLVAQQIERHDFSKPRDLVAWLGAVQAQDYYGAKWALGLRLEKATDATIERALDEGSILRTHAMRGTWQFIAKEDVRWLVALFAPIVLARAAARHRELGLDARTFTRSHAVMEKALRGGRQMTREELASALQNARISTEAQRLSHILVVAELEGVLTSGAGRRFALLDDRAPRSHPLDRKDAIAELAKRYVQSRAPATASDFQWWTGLPMAEARDAIANVNAKLAEPRGKRGGVHLLPAFDEWLIGYRDRSALVDPRVEAGLPERGGMLNPVVIDRGRVVGTWSRTLGKKKMVVTHALLARVDEAALSRATTRYLAFFNPKA